MRIYVISSRLLIFNEYFFNIAKELPFPDSNFYGLDFVNHPSIKNIHEYMSNDDYNEFNFEYVNPSTIFDIDLSLSLFKAMGYNNVPLRLINDGIGIIAKPLSNIFKILIPTLGNMPSGYACFKKGVEYSNWIIGPPPSQLPLIIFVNVFLPYR